MSRCVGIIAFQLHKRAHMTNFLTVQQQVNQWIKTTGIRYFNEMTNLSNLIEEVGELARLMGRIYGEQSFKTGEAPSCPQEAIADELTDVLFIVICLANQMNVDLDRSFNRNMSKKTNRDSQRYLLNGKLRATDKCSQKDSVEESDYVE